MSSSLVFAVSMMMGCSRSSARTRSQISKPFMDGSITSSSSRSKRPVSAFAEPFGAVGGALHVVAVIHEHVLEARADGVLVLDDQQACLAHS